MRIRTTIVNITIVGLLFFLSAHAVGFGIDVKAGANVSFMYGEDYPDNATFRAFPILGAGFGVNIVNFFSIQSELLLSVKGFKDGSLYRQLTYLELVLPIFKLKGPGETVSPNFYIGPAVGLLLKAKEKGDVGSGGLAVADDEVDFDYTTFDFGAIVGAGLEFKAGPGRFIIDARFALGLLNVMEPEVVELPDKTKIESEREARNGAGTIMIGYGFDIGG